MLRAERAEAALEVRVHGDVPHVPGARARARGGEKGQGRRNVEQGLLRGGPGRPRVPRRVREHVEAVRRRARRVREGVQALLRPCRPLRAQERLLQPVPPRVAAPAGVVARRPRHRLQCAPPPSATAMHYAHCDVCLHLRAACTLCPDVSVSFAREAGLLVRMPTAHVCAGTRSSSPVPPPRPGEVEEPEDPMAPEDTDGVAEPPEDAQPESGQDTPGGPPDDGSGVPLPPDPSQPAPGKDAPSETGFPVPELEEPDPGVEIMPPDSAPSESPSDPESPAPPEPAPPDAEPPAQPDAPPGDAPGEAGGTPPVEPGQQAPSIPGSEPSDPGSEDDTETPTGDSQPPLPGQQTPDGPEDTPDAPGTLEPGQPPDPMDPPEPVDPAQPVEPPQVTPDEAAPEPAPPPIQAIAPEPTPGVVGGAAPPQATADDPFVAVAPPGEAAPRTGSDEFVPRPQAPLTERPPDTTASDQFVPRPPEAPIGMVPQRAQTEQ